MKWFHVCVASAFLWVACGPAMAMVTEELAEKRNVETIVQEERHVTDNWQQQQDQARQARLEMVSKLQRVRGTDVASAAPPPAAMPSDPRSSASAWQIPVLGAVVALILLLGAYIGFKTLKLAPANSALARLRAEQKARVAGRGGPQQPGEPQ